MRRVHVAAVAIAALLALASPVPAHAEDATDVHPDIAYALEAEPGGVATGYGSARWRHLGMEMTVPVTRSVGSCPTGYICAYYGASQSGAQLQWSTCGSKSTAALSAVGSIANARASGVLYAREGTTVRASANAGTTANVPVAYRPLITNVYC